MSDGLRRLFVRRDLPLATWTERVFRLERTDAGAKAIENLLAEKAPREISRNEISRICSSHRLTGKTVRRIASGLFERACKESVADDAITDDESKYLTDLRRLLDIGEDEVIRLERQYILPRYERVVGNTLADRQVTDEEREQLKKLADGLRLSEAARTGLFAKQAKPILDAALQDALADHRLTPAEVDRFSQLARNLGIATAYTDGTKKLMDRFTLYWRIENGDIPVVEVPINLQHGETCHYCAPAEWLEVRKQTTTVGYRSHGVSIRIARGVYYRVGESRPQRVTTEGLTSIDRGVIFFTNKRVIFDGDRKNSTIRLSSLLSFEAFEDGIALEKATGKSPHLKLRGDAELAAVVLGVLLARS